MLAAGLQELERPIADLGDAAEPPLEVFSSHGFFVETAQQGPSKQVYHLVRRNTRRNVPQHDPSHLTPYTGKHIGEHDQFAVHSAAAYKSPYMRLKTFSLPAERRMRLMYQQLLTPPTHGDVPSA